MLQRVERRVERWRQASETGNDNEAPAKPAKATDGLEHPPATLSPGSYE